MTTLTIERPAHDAMFSGFRGLELTHGRGCHVFDARGRRWFDATSMYGVASLGHAHPVLAQAIAEQARTLIACFASHANPQRSRLCERLAELLMPDAQVFLCNSGTEAVEAAIKVARAATKRCGVVALEAAFHGRTFGALSATHRPSHRDAFGPLVPGFVHVPVGDIAAFERALTPDVALAIVELVQGEGGVLPLDRSYVTAMRALCRERGVLFAIDEVQTGIGRTGVWFAHSDVALVPDLEPDLVCLAKGLAGGVPIGALVMRAELAKLPAGSHGSTFGGNPLACAAANAVLDVIERDGLVERARINGARLLARLTERLAPHPAVRAIRGRGLMIGIELRVRSAPVQQRLQERGYLVLGAGPNVVRLLPPLVATWDELAELADVLCEEIARETVGREPSERAVAERQVSARPSSERAASERTANERESIDSATADRSVVDHATIVRSSTDNEARP